MKCAMCSIILFILFMYTLYMHLNFEVLKYLGIFLWNSVHSAVIFTKNSLL